MKNVGLEKEEKMSAGAATHTPFSSEGALQPSHSTFWVVALVYLIVNIALNVLTDTRQFARSGVTLWSPDDGLSMLLIMESLFFTPIVIIGNIFVDLYVHKVSSDVIAIISSETALSIGYFVVSMILRDIFKINVRKVNLETILSLLVTLPAAAAFAALLYCGTLALYGQIPSMLLGSAVYQFWLGDMVGMIVVIPAAIAIYDVVSNSRWRMVAKRKDYIWLSMLTLCLLVFSIISAGQNEDHHLFYILFIPIIWISINYGFVGSALSLLAAQLFVIAALAYFKVNDSQFGVFQTLMFILSATGLLLGVVITEREQAERRLRDQHAELARIGAQAAAGALASMVAHEISQPLAAMSIYVHSARLILDNGQTTQSIAEVRAALAEAEAQGQRTRVIMQRIRDFVAGGNLTFESIDLFQLVQKLSKLNEEYAEDRDVALRTEASTPNTSVRADRIAIEQALNNLIRNAIDSASERVDNLGCVVIRLAQSGNRIVVDVDDNGGGVAPEIAEKLFETFETTKPDGMGLGLPLALRIARRHSGSLTWRPLEPQGARFSIELPIQGPEQNAD